jgi:multiple sugar transport system permease protein
MSTRSARRRGARERAKTVGQAWAYAVLILFGVVVVFPYAWMLLTSIKPLEEFFTFPLRWLSENWTLTHYRLILEDPRFLRSVWNSTVVSVSVTAINLAVGIPAAYGLTRLRPPGSRPLLLTVLSSQFLPPMIFFVPFYIYLGRFELLNTLQGLTITYLAITMPVAVWLIASAFRQVPAELEDAARIDGCNELQVLGRIVLPLTLPGVATAGLFSFVLAWQEYIFALLYTTTTAAQTAPVMLFFFLGQHQIDYGRLMAAAVLLSLPVIVPFAFAQRYYRPDATAGGVKG